MKRKILVSVTTLSDNGWQSKIKEIRKFKIKEIALFVTVLYLDERKKLYKALEETDVKSIPLVHARTDFESWELDYLVKRFHTKAFNFHYWKDAEEFLEKNKKYKNIIYFENVDKIDDGFINMVKKSGGLCIDISHWEAKGIKDKKPTYKRLKKLASTYKIGCNHISAVSDKKTLYIDKNTGKRWIEYDAHWLESFDQLNYVKKYVKYLSNIVAIELENSIAEQLAVKKYLEKIIKDSKKRK